VDEKEAIRLPNSIMALDDAVFGVSIVTNVGAPLARIRKEGHLAKSPTREQWETKSWRNAAIFAAAHAEDNRLSRALSIES
jgi:hypothetical protein